LRSPKSWMISLPNPTASSKGGDWYYRVAPALPKIPARCFFHPRDEVKWRKRHLTIEKLIVEKDSTKSAEKMLCRHCSEETRHCRHIASNTHRAVSLNSTYEIQPEFQTLTCVLAQTQPLHGYNLPLLTKSSF
jgi:hypothetical protein